MLSAPSLNYKKPQKTVQVDGSFVKIQQNLLARKPYCESRNHMFVNPRKKAYLCAISDEVEMANSLHRPPIAPTR